METCKAKMEELGTTLTRNKPTLCPRNMEIR